MNHSPYRFRLFGRWVLLGCGALLLGGWCATPGRGQGEGAWPSPGTHRPDGRESGGSGAPAEARAPFTLSPQEEAYLDQILRYWEYRSSQIKTFQCNFTRWEYDNIFGPRDPNVAKTASEGEIKYAAPDKGLFRVRVLREHDPNSPPGGPPQYNEQKGEQLDYWVCDGKSVFEFDAKNRRVIDRELPPDMRGRSIADDGPLPFLFGAKAETIRERYWVRVVPPPNEGEYWLQAYPKRREDAADFKLVEVILDEQLFLPKAIQIYAPTYDGRQNHSRTVFVFGERKVNEKNLLANLNLFHREFYEPSVPLGWRKVRVPYVEPQTQAGPLEHGAGDDRATSTPPPRRW